MAVFRIMLREWRRIVTLPVHYWVLLVLPAVLCVFYAFIYQHKHAIDQPVAIWDEARSPLSRQFSFMLEQTESIHITCQVNSQAELEEKIKRGEVLAAVHFPKRMDEHIKSRRPVYITVYTNTAFVVTAKLIYKDAATVLVTAGSGVVLQKLMKTGMPKGKAMALVQPVVNDMYMLYNPTYDYQQYLVPGLIAMGLQMMVLMVMVLVLNYEKTTGTLPELYAMANGSASTVIAGKGLAHLGVAWMNFMLVTGVFYPLFAGGAVAFTWGLFILYTLLIIACIGIGMLVSAIIDDTMVACDIGLFYTSPAFVFSGFTFPRWGMPWYDQYYAMIMPFTPFLDGFFKVYYMQLPLYYARQEILHLLLFILLTFPLTIFIHQYKLNKSALQHA